LRAVYCVDDHPGRGPYNACTRATAAN